MRLQIRKLHLQRLLENSPEASSVGIDIDAQRICAIDNSGDEIGSVDIPAGEISIYPGVSKEELIEISKDTHKSFMVIFSEYFSLGYIDDEGITEKGRQKAFDILFKRGITAGENALLFLHYSKTSHEIGSMSVEQLENITVELSESLKDIVKDIEEKENEQD